MKQKRCFQTLGGLITENNNYFVSFLSTNKLTNEKNSYSSSCVWPFSGLTAQNSYSTSITSSNPYYTPGDTVSLTLTVDSTFSPFNFFQFAFAPLGMVSSSQLIVCSTAQTPNYYSQGTYSVDIVGTTSISYGSYLLFAQASSNSEVDTVGYVTFGPALSPPSFSESIVTSATEYCYGEAVSLSIDSIPLDSVVLDVPATFPSGNVLWILFRTLRRSFNPYNTPQK